MWCGWRSVSGVGVVKWVWVVWVVGGDVGSDVAGERARAGGTCVCRLYLSSFSCLLLTRSSSFLYFTPLVSLFSSSSSPLSFLLLLLSLSLHPSLPRSPSARPTLRCVDRYDRGGGCRCYFCPRFVPLPPPSLTLLFLFRSLTPPPHLPLITSYVE